MDTIEIRRLSNYLKRQPTSYVIEHIAVNLDSGGQVDVIHMNFSKAFDRPDHEKISRGVSLF